jgi:hypothetical protein
MNPKIATTKLKDDDWICPENVLRADDLHFYNQQVHKWVKFLKAGEP